MTDSRALYATIGKFGFVYDLSLTVSGYKQGVGTFVRALVEEADSPFISVLDVGCGTGQYALRILRTFPEVRVTAFDLEESMTQRTRRNLERAGFSSRVHVFPADARGPLAELTEQFDALIISGVLEYTPLRETIQNLSRFLKPGGYLMHSPVRDTAFGRLVGILYRFKPLNREDVIRAFTAEGFELRRIITLPTFLPASFKEAQIFHKRRDN